jgi:hypothetical protein
MPATIKIKNSSTASAVPTSSDLVQGELAVNVTDKRIFTENASGTVVELGTNPSILTLPDGSASAPTLTNDGDTNTGLFFPAADTVGITTGGTERLRVDSAGNMGLGVTPSAWASGTYKAFQVSGGGAISGSTGQVNLSQNWVGESGADKYISTAAASSYAQALGVHKWFNAPSGTAGNAITFTQAMTLDSSGNLLVRKTTYSDSTSVGGYIAYDGGIASTKSESTNAAITNIVYSTGAGAYRFYVGMGGTVYATSTTISGISDQRLKENIRDLDVGLAEVMALQPRLYDWKEGKGADTKNARGFIAQEFEEVFPDLIDEWRDPAPEGEEPYKSVRQDLIPVLVKAIQEQQAIIETLTNRITALEQA